MRKTGIFFAVLFAFAFCGNLAVSCLESGSTITCEGKSKSSADEKTLYKNELFGLIFRKPVNYKVAGVNDFDFRVNDDCDTLLVEDCEFCGNITEETNVDFCIEFKSKNDICYFSGGFGAVITTEESCGKTAGEILRGKVENDITEQGESPDFGYFNYGIAGEDFSAAWIIERGKCNWLRKIYVRVKEKKAMVIYLDCSAEGKYDEKRNTAIKAKVEKPTKDDDEWFYSCFLQSSKKPSEIGVYFVQNGDNLWSLCNRFYGDGEKYEEIKKYNKLKNDRLKIGQRLSIPKL